MHPLFDAESFWKKVRKGTPVQCWEWQGLRSSKGYGHVYAGATYLGVAHRCSYELVVGAIPEGATIDHLCRNRACVNPAHLEPVSQRENVLRGIGHSAQNARKTHCHDGHELAGDNLYLRNGRRHCRACRSESWRKALADRKTMPHPRDRTHCPKGHAYQGDNLRMEAGKRVCGECRRAGRRKRYHERRALGWQPWKK